MKRAYPESILDLIDRRDPWVDQIVEWLNKGYSPLGVARVFNVTEFSIEYLLASPQDSRYQILSEPRRIMNRILRDRDEAEMRTAKTILSQIRKAANERLKKGM